MGVGYLYILKNPKEVFYIGSTNDISRRIEEHNTGNTRSTRNKGPWVLVFSQKFENLIDARKIESRLKKFKRKDIIERIVREQRLLLGN